jgi:hypothetical protein
MKKLATLTFASLATVAFAGQPVVTTYDKGYKAPPEEPCFAEQELQLDIYGAFVETEGNTHNGGWGGGIGVNYYFSRHIGIGVDYTITDGEGEELHHVNGHLLARWPIDLGDLCLAPYLKLGGGWQVNGGSDGNYGGGGGIEFRLNPTFGIFAEGGYYWSGDDDEYIQAKAGIRFIF